MGPSQFAELNEKSLRPLLDSGHLLVTPAGMSKGEVTEADLVVVDPEGQLVSGNHRASSEVRMHIRIYRRRSDVHAVVHAHPPTATAFALNAAVR